MLVGHPLDTLKVKLQVRHCAMNPCGFGSLGLHHLGHAQRLQHADALAGRAGVVFVAARGQMCATLHNIPLQIARILLS